MPHTVLLTLSTHLIGNTHARTSLHSIDIQIESPKLETNKKLIIFSESFQRALTNPSLSYKVENFTFIFIVFRRLHVWYVSLGWWVFR